MPEPISIPLSASHQRDVAALQAQQATAQSQLNLIARTLIGVSHDPETFATHAVTFTSTLLVLTPPAKVPR